MGSSSDSSAPGRGAFPVPTGIQRLLRLASVDDRFRRELLEKRAEVARAAGIPLTPSEAAVLAAIPAAQLEEMARRLPPPPPSRREFLRQTASTAVVLLGGAALAECVGCRKEAGAGNVAADGAGGDGPSPPDTALDAGVDAPPPRPDYDPTMMEGGISPRLRDPDWPGPPAGIRPDLPPPVDEDPERVNEFGPDAGTAEVPPERVVHPPMPSGGGAAPDWPELRPLYNETQNRGGSRPE